MVPTVNYWLGFAQIEAICTWAAFTKMAVIIQLNKYSIQQKK